MPSESMPDMSYNEQKILEQNEKTTNIYFHILYLLVGSSHTKFVNIITLTASIKKKLLKKGRTSPTFRYINWCLGNDSNEPNLIDLLVYAHKYKKNVTFLRMQFLERISFDIFRLEYETVTFYENILINSEDLIRKNSNEEIFEYAVHDLLTLFKSQQIKNIFVLNQNSTLSNLPSLIKYSKRTRGNRKAEVVDVEVPIETVWRTDEIDIRECGINNDNVEYMVDCDAIIGIVRLGHASSLFMNPITISSLNSINYKARARKINCFDDAKIHKLEELVQFKLGCYESFLGSASIVLITTINNSQDFMAGNFKDVYNLALEEFVAGRCPLSVGITHSRPRFYSSLHRRKETSSISGGSITNSSFKNITLCENETADFFNYIHSNEQLSKKIAGIMVEVFGTKRFIVSKNIFQVYSKIENFFNLTVLCYFDIDLNISLMPREAKSRKRLYFNSPPAFINSTKGIYCQFFSKKLKNQNVRLQDKIRNTRLTVNNTNINKVNTYSSLYCSIVENYTRKKKGIFLLQATIMKILSKNLREVPEASEEETMERTLKEIRSISTNISLLGKSCVPYRNEINCDILQASVNLEKIRKEIISNQQKLFWADLESVKSYLMSLLNTFREISEIEMKNINKASLIKIAIAEVVFHEFFLRGSKNLHQLQNRQLQFFLEGLTICDAVPVYQLTEITEKAIRYFHFDDLKSILSKIFRYKRINNRVCRSRLDTFYEVICMENTVELVSIGLERYFNFMRTKTGLNILDTSEEIQNRININVWITKFIDNCNNNAFVRKWPIVYCFSLILTLEITSKPELHNYIRTFLIGNMFAIVYLHTNLEKVILIKLKLIETETFIFDQRQEATRLKDLIKSRTDLKRLNWTESDFARLAAAIDMYGRRFSEILNDLRYCFTGICSADKLKDASKRILQKEESFKERVYCLKEFFKAEYIGLVDILKIYNCSYFLEADYEIFQNFEFYLKNSKQQFNINANQQNPLFEQFYVEERVTECTKNFISSLRSENTHYDTLTVPSSDGIQRHNFQETSQNSNLDHLDNNHQDFVTSPNHDLTSQVTDFIDMRNLQEIEEESNLPHLNNNYPEFVTSPNPDRTGRITDFGDIANFQETYAVHTLDFNEIERDLPSLDACPNTDLDINLIESCLENNAQHTQREDVVEENFTDSKCASISKIRKKLLVYLSSERVNVGTRIYPSYLRKNYFYRTRRPALAEIIQVFDELCASGIVEKNIVRNGICYIVQRKPNTGGSSNDYCNL